MNFYTADLHFGQESLLATGKWKERPFSTLEEMHKDQIKKWNKKVTNGDEVYVLGDVGSRGYHHMHQELLAQLKGRKHLVLGNHDDVSDLRVRQQFVEIVQTKKLIDPCHGRNQKLLLTHCPYMMWEGQHKGTIMLYGHLHNTIDEKLFQKYLKEYNQDRVPKEEKKETLCQAFSVCQCLWDFEPVTLEEILKRAERGGESPAYR